MTTRDNGTRQPIMIRTALTGLMLIGATMFVALSACGGDDTAEEDPTSADEDRSAQSAGCKTYRMGACYKSSGATSWSYQRVAICSDTLGPCGTLSGTGTVWAKSQSQCESKAKAMPATYSSLYPRTCGSGVAGVPGAWGTSSMFTPVTPATPRGSCAGTTSQQYCQGNFIVWCANGALQSRDCGLQTCGTNAYGWAECLSRGSSSGSSTTDGYRGGTAGGTCGFVDNNGSCQTVVGDAFAVYCYNGTIMSKKCLSGCNPRGYLQKGADCY